MQKGKLIVLYGINNLWKTTQAHLLIDRLRAKGLQAEYLKYPIYDLAPSWPLLNAYLREGNPNQLSSSEFQLLQVINRTQYDSILKNKLENWIWIIAEDWNWYRTRNWSLMRPSFPRKHQLSLTQRRPCLLLWWRTLQLWNWKSPPTWAK